jgi:hypothetical protein
MSQQRQRYLDVRYDKAERLHPEVGRQIRERALERIRANPAKFRKLRDLTEFQNAMEPDLPDALQHILSLVEIEVSDQEACELVAEMDHFPVLKTDLRAQVRLNYHGYTNPDPPGTDKVFDYHHLMEAAYCDIFVTNDKQLTQHAEFISPHLHVIKFEELPTY